jgi:hypothetical protein
MTLNLSGKRFGRVTALSPTTSRQGASIIWKCKCDCGNEDALISARDLVHTPRRGCGVCHDADDELYAIWAGIISRCTDRKNSSYKHYGGRGIKLAPEWRYDFLAFKQHLGPRPSKFHSVDRINNDGNYEPGNVRWATSLQQANNKRQLPRKLSDADILEIYCSKDVSENFAKKFGVSISVLYNIRSFNHGMHAAKVCLEHIKSKAATNPTNVPIGE